jgi:hypothetical protein
MNGKVAKKTAKGGGRERCWRVDEGGSARGVEYLTTGDSAGAPLGLARDVKEPCPQAACSAATPGRGELNGFDAYKFSLFAADCVAPYVAFMGPKESAGGVGGAARAAERSPARSCSQLCSGGGMSAMDKGNIKTNGAA